jgi:tRNA-modifying protein YgfZ
MNQQWKQFLESQSATIDAEAVVNFENGNQLTDCALFDLSHLRFIKVSGDDAEFFLQGQFTNDIRKVSPQHHQMAGYCTPKGRMLANFRIFSHHGAYILQLPPDTADALLKRLSMYILRSQVTLEDVSDQLVAMGLAGDCSPELLTTAFDSVPKDQGDSVQQNGMTMMRIPGPTPRFEIIAQPEQAMELWQSFATTAKTTNLGIWSLLDIRSGIPTIHAGTAEAFVPQMVNMQLINGVSFDKGCYVGQEVVARMKYLGELKRRMYLAWTDASTQPQPGDELYSTIKTESGQGPGKVVVSAASPHGGYELLAVIENSSLEANTLHLGDDSGPKLELKSLPYTFED